MEELNRPCLAFAFVEVIHVELDRGEGTCLMKEEKLECLKKIGRSSLEKAASSSISKELPWGSQRMTWEWEESSSMLQVLSMNVGTEDFLILLLYRSFQY